MDLPLARAARERYEFDAAIVPPIAETGSGVATARLLSRRMSELRAAGAPRPPTARQLQAMAIVHEAMHRVARRIDDSGGERLFRTALDGVAQEVGAQPAEEALQAYVTEFPPPLSYRDELPPAEFLDGSSEERPHRELALEELLFLWLANRNPAFMRHDELFNDWPVARASLYTEIVEGLRRHLAAATGPGEADLVTVLLAPIQAAPDSIAGQLRYIRDHWPEASDLVDSLGPGDLLDRLDQDVDDDSVAVPAAGAGGPGPPDAQALHGFTDLDAETEGYSADLDWMARLVLIAKSTYVWLDQLSRDYGRSIRTLDAIPDEELDQLASRGLTGLWLIGVWERSAASQRIKQSRGNPEAVASAYSLMDYRISEDLGGEDAFADLRDRAWARGIRLAADMVPNHMGIDSRWVVEHPDRFISRSDSPFPSYSFTGPNLSPDERVGIYLEDHYQDGSDAAVVFKRVDRWSGQERYVYHGNDGTGMPWNDTAQLDYLGAETREAVMAAILAVAHRAPIIRFDAAMTLARRHIQRLWYPQPGSGESIPSRAESAMDPAEFAKLLPVEFWREVVERVAAEAPDTLLLAEAFWLMEGYFVRTLGMHRVYNSAFMHMLRDESNADFRLVLKNTLAFDPEILQRYVNFMSNPDERTAIDQFGDGDKYLGVATMLATLPGLPMLGHGQVEGYSERYGMEFRRARIDEQPRSDLLELHERHIFPLLHQRRLFAGARAFRLYDMRDGDGATLEDVYAYSNSDGDRRALVIYHNRYAEVRGHIRDSAPVSGTVDGGLPSAPATLAVSLGLPAEDDAWLILRDERSGQEWLSSCREIHDRGLDVELRAYECRVFLDLRVVLDGADHLHQGLAHRLAGAPVASVEAAIAESLEQSIRQAITGVLDAAALRRVAGTALGPDDANVDAALTAETDRVRPLLGDMAEAACRPEASRQASDTLEARSRSLVAMFRSGRRPGAAGEPAALARWLAADRVRWCSILGWMYGAAIAELLDAQDGGDWWARWDPGSALTDACRQLGVDDDEASRTVAVVRAALSPERPQVTGPAQDREPIDQLIAAAEQVRRMAEGPDRDTRGG